MTMKARARWVLLGLAVLIGIPAGIMAVHALQFWAVLRAMH